MGLKFRGTREQQQRYFAHMNKIENLKKLQERDGMLLGHAKNIQSDNWGDNTYYKNEKRFMKFDNVDIDKLTKLRVKRENKIELLDDELTKEMKKIYHYENEDGTFREI
jgi:hypothetical protein